MPRSSANRNRIPDLGNTEIAFRGKSDAQLREDRRMFSLMSVPFLRKAAKPLVNTALKIGLPIRSLIQKTVFNHFCGGETIAECEETIEALARVNVGSILDYSVEGGSDESAFDNTCEEIIRTIERAKGDPNIPFTVFKISGLGNPQILERRDQGALSQGEIVEFAAIRFRVSRICARAYELQVRVMIDAEESWIQNSIDALALEMMKRYNQNRAVVFNTYQLYLKNKFDMVKNDIAMGKEEGFIPGLKLVRGAYLEKETQRAQKMGYTSPLQDGKTQTDADYDRALEFCSSHLNSAAIVAGTHNEKSVMLLARLLDEKKIPRNHPNVYFSQLLGMGDHISFNLADAGYNVAKYVPYGPVEAVIPYLFRRVEENSAVAGQTSRELKLIEEEVRRRAV